MNKLYPLCLLALWFPFISCEKEETPISLPPSGEVERVEINLQPDYSEQHYFDFETGRVLSSNSKMAWDLGMSCQDWTITLNSSKAMRVAVVENSSIEKAELPEDPLWVYDHQSGIVDSMAIGPSWSENHVYFIDRGYDPEGNMIGVVKVSFEKSDGNYFVKYASTSPNSGYIKSVLVEKDAAFQNVHLSLDSVPNFDYLEPETTEWELYLGQYTFLFFEPTFTPYLVTGVLINQEGAGVYVDSSNTFEDISFEFAESVTFNNRRDIIGYDWKEFSFETSSFTVDTKTNYIFKTYAGFYYKMHFIDFYTTSGEKGNIVFEYQRL